MSEDHEIAIVEAERREKDHYFKTEDWSPIPERERKEFRGLRYLPYDRAYRVPAQFHLNPHPKAVILGTSRGGNRHYLRYGYFEFSLGGKPLRLQAYKESSREQSSLFVPFRDATSGKETYGAGRYLDIEEEPSGSYIIDFNLAYNPYCAYSDGYVCPLPPQENWLGVPILAGEKNYELRHQAL